jgi:hypothetical protein
MDGTPRFDMKGGPFFSWKKGGIRSIVCTTLDCIPSFTNIKRPCIFYMDTFMSAKEQNTTIHDTIVRPYRKDRAEGSFRNKILC